MRLIRCEGVGAVGLTISCANGTEEDKVGHDRSRIGQWLVPGAARRRGEQTVVGCRLGLMARMFLLLGIGLACGGCQTPSAQVGRTGVEFVEPTGSPTRGKVDLQPDASDIRIRPIAAHPRGTLAKPVYPAEVLKSGGRSYVLYVTFTVDESGQIVDVGRSWKRPSPPDEFADLFLAAARDAIAQWEIEPARRVYWQTTPSGEDRYLRTERIAETFEVKFTFEVSGEVR